GLGLDEGRALAAARAADRLAGGLVDREQILTVHRDAGHAEAAGARGDVAARDRVLRRSRLGVAVVLADEDHRQLPDAGQVHAFERRTLVRGAVAEEADRHLVGALALRRQARAAGQRRPAADDAVGAQHALADVGDMHRAALALAGAGGLAVDL